MPAYQRAPIGNPNKDSSAARKKDGPPNTDGWLTREESARLLGCAIQTVKNYEDRGLLHPQRVLRLDHLNRQHEVALYDPQELIKFREALRKSPDALADTSAWYTRTQSCDFLGVCAQTLKNYEAQGRVHPKHVTRRDARGHEHLMVVYDPVELSKLPRGAGRAIPSRDPREVHARCAELFEQGKTINEVVIELRETFHTVNELHDMWFNGGGAEIVITGEARKDLEKMLGPFTGVAELVALVAKKLPQPDEAQSAT